MSELENPEGRPFDPTEWERTSELHAHQRSEDINNLIKASQEIADDTKAVQALTKESLISDNKRFRRRNTTLVSLVIMLLAAVGFLVYRDIFINGPERDIIRQNTAGLQEANAKLDDINEFIESIDSDPEPDPQLQEVFRAVFEIRETTRAFVCSIPDPRAEEICIEITGTTP